MTEKQRPLFPDGNTGPPESWDSAGPGELSVRFILPAGHLCGGLREMPTSARLQDVTVTGELLRRAELNFRRLHDAEFQFDAMIRAFTAKEAPGDWVGRELLALVLHAQLLKREAPHLREIVDRLQEAVNARGYIGEVHPEGFADENQIAGHNALLRGLAEHYRWSGDTRSLAMIRTIVDRLMLPAEQLFASYPDRRLSHMIDRQIVGLTVRQESGVWVGLSTDIGAVFGTLDGLTQAHAVAPSPGLHSLIETMIARFAVIDPVEISAQTHSTLSALRGILRWWRDAAPRPEFLALVRQRFQTYLDTAVTEAHGNYNWFGRPDWTEPCAIVDAFMLAVQLWSATGEGALLEEAHRIFYNALGHAQRPNGGYGCDCCVGARGQLVLTPHEFFEAPWCCSMRGAEGLARAAQHGWFADGDAIVLPFYFGGAARLHLGDGEVTIDQTSDYPLSGSVTLRVIASTVTGPCAMRFFAPSWSPPDEFRVTHNGSELAAVAGESFATVTALLRTGDVIALEFPVRFSLVAPQNSGRMPGHRRFAHGPLLLGDCSAKSSELAADEEFIPLGGARYRCESSGCEIGPLPSLIDFTEAEAKASRSQILFPNSRP
jgi:hypothetical protein